MLSRRKILQECTYKNIEEEHMDTKLEARIKAASVNGRLPCPVAFQIAKDLNLELKEMGEAIDRLGIKVNECQLGLFGKPHKS
jgi:hypothetical protein